MITFPPKKGFTIILPTFGLVTLLLIPSFLILFSSAVSIYFWLAFFLFSYAFIIGMSYLAQYTTCYWIDADYFHYKSLFLKGSVDIKSIRKIEMNASCWSSNKPATCNKGGMLIHYGKFDDIFITPEDNEELLKHLLSIHSDIPIRYLK